LPVCCLAFPYFCDITIGYLLMESDTKDQGWEAAYAEYLAEKEAVENQELIHCDVPKQQIIGEDEGWEAQYAADCAEKEAKLRAQDTRTPQNES
jgi:hypothetical protein